MAKVYTYPHVQVNTYARTHRTVNPSQEDTTAAFFAFVSKYGPANEIKRIFSLEEFINEYGDLDFATQGQTALNIANWLTYGGTVYAYRMVAEGAEKASGSVSKSYEVQDAEPIAITFSITAKYPGAAYNDLEIILTNLGNKTVSYVVRNGKNVVESMTRLTYKKLISVPDNSQFIGSLTFSEEDFETFLEKSEVGAILKITTASGSDGEFAGENRTQLDLGLEQFFIDQRDAAKSVLSNALEVPIQIILDAGYSDAVKKAMYDFITDETMGRSEDVLLILDETVAKVADGKYVGTLGDESEETLNYFVDGAVVKYSDQQFNISENAYAGKDIYVSITYFLSNLIPYNDSIYGIQYPVAGLTRGKLNGVKAISINPSPTEKQEMFSKRINYIEKDSRGIYIMSQRTFDHEESEGLYSALSFMNNVRVKNKMVQELKRLGREYLFEFNDATTLSNMANALNRYAETWVQNRVLSYANVTVEADEFSNETVNVTLSIKFTGTIEVINIDIQID